MSISQKNAFALLLDINQNIEEYSDETVRNIVENKNFDTLVYPPNAGFSDSEIQELKKLDNNEHLKNALRKILADNAASVIFNLLNNIDGTGTPKLAYDDWTGVKLVDEEESSEEGRLFEDMLHDGLFETYWEWKKLRSSKPWQLDTYDEDPG